MRSLFCLILLLGAQLAYADFLKAPKGRKFALVVAVPSEQGLTDGQKQLVHKAQGWLQESMPTLLQSLSKVLMSSQGSKDVFLSGSQEIKDDLLAKLSAVRKQLPREHISLNAYFMAWPEEKLPQETGAWDYPVVIISQTAEDYATVKYGIQDTVNANYSNGERYQFAAAAFKIRLEQAISIFSMQFFGGLNPGVTEFIEKGDEVDLDKIVIPDVDTFGASVYYAPTVLLTIRQILNEESLPTMTLDFGTFGGIANDVASAGGFSAKGELQISRDNISLGGERDCDLKKATPTLKGVLGPKATGLSIIDEIARGRDVQFRIFSINWDVVAKKIGFMDVRMDLGILQCLSLEGVKTKFKDKANIAIENKLNSLSRQDDLTDKLMDDLYRLKMKQK